MADPLGFLQSVLKGTYNGMSAAGEDLARGAVDAATLPRDVYQGKVQTDPRYMSDEDFARTLNLAGNVAGGGVTLGSAPEGALGMFAGRRSKTFPWTEAVAADIGEQMGKHPTDIYKNTGLFRGVDDKLRYEIPDEAARIKPAAGPLEPGQRLRAADYFDHPELFKAYPELGEIPVMHQPGMNGAAHAAPHGDYPNGYIKMDMVKNAHAFNDDAPRSMMLHELQHAIQNREGFATGANSGADYIQKAKPVMSLPEGSVERRRESWHAYARSAGETEARQVQERADWPLERRMEMHPLQQQMTKKYPGDPAYRPPLDQQWIAGKELPYPAEAYDPNLPFLAQYLGK